ncbi:MAG TPA: MmcQ/YjbR family DNA-binding protein [Flavisolibacter sp.]|nr:MmcQ/YjbR family DNA-binding protein [Flavisolibacter sp.]
MNIDLLRTFCLSLKGSTEDVKWENDLVFSVGGKMYCVAALNPPFSCSFKVKDEEFEELCQAEGFRPAPYLARAKWVLVEKADQLHKKEWEERLRQSYQLVLGKLSKKERLSLGL